MEKDQIIRTVVVDDEVKCLLSLTNMLMHEAPQVRIVGQAQNVADAVVVIDTQKPDLVFLDIAMPDGEGFDVIQKTAWKHFEIVFVTAYNQYAIKAFGFAAIHYLLKPVEKDDLMEAMHRFISHTSKPLLEEKLRVFRQSFDKVPEKIILPTFEGFVVINLNDIVRCEAEGNYTHFFLADSRKILISKNLNNFEKLLSEIHFCRVHHKHLVNLAYVGNYHKGKGGTILMKDGDAVDVSESRKQPFLDQLKQFARHLP